MNTENPESCPNCGVIIPAKSNFCYKCGHKITPDDNEVFSGEEMLNFDSMIVYPEEKFEEDGDTIAVRLFKLVSIVDDFKYKDKVYNNVKIYWYVVDRDSPSIPYEKVVMLYDRMSEKEKENIRLYMDEKFTLREGRFLEKYIEKTPSINTIFEEIKLPVVENVLSYKNIIGLQGTSRIVLHEKPRYNLPFKVEGLFNINDAEESISWDSQPTVISKSMKDDLEEYKRNL